MISCMSTEGALLPFLRAAYSSSTKHHEMSLQKKKKRLILLTLRISKSCKFTSLIWGQMSIHTHHHHQYMAYFIKSAKKLTLVYSHWHYQAERNTVHCVPFCSHLHHLHYQMKYHYDCCYCTNRSQIHPTWRWRNLSAVCWKDRIQHVVGYSKSEYHPVCLLWMLLQIGSMV